jgi:hypothetical protein
LRPNAPARRLDNPGYELERSTLTSAIGTDESDKFALMDLKIHILQHPKGPLLLPFLKNGGECLPKRPRAAFLKLETLGNVLKGNDSFITHTSITRIHTISSASS